MSAKFESVRNSHEVAVFRQILEQAGRFPDLAANDDLLADVACLALNALSPRYIRHAVDLSFYTPDASLLADAAAVRAAVESALEFVQTQAAHRGT